MTHQERETISLVIWELQQVRDVINFAKGFTDHIRAIKRIAEAQEKLYQMAGRY